MALAQPGTAVVAPVAQATEPGPRFASVWRMRGDISATLGETGRTRKLQQGDAVYVGERIRAGTSAEAILKTEDAGLLAVRPGGIFVAERFVAEGQPGDVFSLRVVSGALRLITGWIGRSNRAQYRVLTPSATIGIRGTDHETYVMTAELASTMAQPAGTYDKVNRGGTTLSTTNNTLDIEPGKVGFVRRTAPTRALMTLLLPVLLDRVPAFYVPGAFDAELDQLSAQADETALRQLEQRRRTLSAPLPAVVASAPAGDTASATLATAVAPTPASASTGAQQSSLSLAACGAGNVARTWLAQLDAAVARRNASAILRLFAPQVMVQATVRNEDGTPTTVQMGRDEFARSTVAALKKLAGYTQRRPLTDGQPEQAGSCDRIVVKSVVIEQGRQNGQPYRFESIEEYTLERQRGKWLAIHAATVQR